MWGGNIDLYYSLRLILLFSSQVYISLLKWDLVRVWAWRVTWKECLGLFFPLSVILSLVTENEHRRTWEEQSLERDLVIKVTQGLLVSKKVNGRCSGISVDRSRRDVFVRSEFICPKPFLYGSSGPAAMLVLGLVDLSIVSWTAWSFSHLKQSATVVNKW